MTQNHIIVVDTSVIIKWLNQENENYLEQATQLLKDTQANEVMGVSN